MIIRTNVSRKKKKVEFKKPEPIVEPAVVEEEVIVKPVREYKVKKKKSEVVLDDWASFLKEDEDNN